MSKSRRKNEASRQLKKINRAPRTRAQQSRTRKEQETQERKKLRQTVHVKCNTSLSVLASGMDSESDPKLSSTLRAPEDRRRSRTSFFGRRPWAIASSSDNEM